MNKNLAELLHETVKQAAQEYRACLTVNSTSHRIGDDVELAQCAEQMVNKTGEALRDFLKHDGTLTDALYYIASMFSDKQVADLVHRRLPTYMVMPDPLEDNGQHHSD